eukprot:TRINITY_DN66572_c0_g3_i3.p1 TRINITY_DN66572_c0_g3~~TRINITY_DN66572_c0_g3_i3.p1  ORF type:complete len:537 (-),score=62.19 TRINITY_DN66572_c0_g3_i3:521-2131(-)
MQTHTAVVALTCFFVFASAASTSTVPPCGMSVAIGHSLEDSITSDLGRLCNVVLPGKVFKSIGGKHFNVTHAHISKAHCGKAEVIKQLPSTMKVVFRDVLLIFEAHVTVDIPYENVHPDGKLKVTTTSAAITVSLTWGMADNKPTIKGASHINLNAQFAYNGTDEKYVDAFLDLVQPIINEAADDEIAFLITDKLESMTSSVQELPNPSPLKDKHTKELGHSIGFLWSLVEAPSWSAVYPELFLVRLAADFVLMGPDGSFAECPCIQDYDPKAVLPDAMNNVDNFQLLLSDRTLNTALWTFHKDPAFKKIIHWREANSSLSPWPVFRTDLWKKYIPDLYKKWPDQHFDVEVSVGSNPAVYSLNSTQNELGISFPIELSLYMYPDDPSKRVHAISIVLAFNLQTALLVQTDPKNVNRWHVMGDNTKISPVEVYQAEGRDTALGIVKIQHQQELMADLTVLGSGVIDGVLKTGWTFSKSMAVGALGNLVTSQLDIRVINNSTEGTAAFLYLGGEVMLVPNTRWEKRQAKRAISIQQLG